MHVENLPPTSFCASKSLCRSVSRELQSTLLPHAQQTTLTSSAHRAQQHLCLRSSLPQSAQNPLSVTKTLRSNSAWKHFGKRHRCDAEVLPQGEEARAADYSDAQGPENSAASLPDSFSGAARPKRRELRNISPHLRPAKRLRVAQES